MAGTRVSGFGSTLPDYFERWNSQVVVGVQIETTAALVEDHRAPLVELRIVFPSGTAAPWFREAHAEEAFEKGKRAYLEGDFLMGETYDAQKEMPGWSTASSVPFRGAASTWPSRATWRSPTI